VGLPPVLSQRAYTRAPSRVSLPVLTVANPVVAIIFVDYVFREAPADTPAAVAIELACLIL
jgi:hypothetical protein